MNARMLFLGGEGANELGSRARELSYQEGEFPGVIEALLRLVQAEGWVVVGALRWTKIRKFKAAGPTPAEERNVLGLALEADRAGADVLAFLRDADGDQRRKRAIELAIAKASERHPKLEIVGGVPTPVLEAWILAFLGDHRTEHLSKSGAQEALEKRHRVLRKDTAAMVACIGRAEVEKIPKDAATLHQWLKDARRVLAKEVQ